MFINLTNHPSENWNEGQLAAARQYGEIIDIHFPNLEPSFTSSKINSLTDSTVNTITELSKDITVHIMGKTTFTFAVVTRLKALGMLGINLSRFYYRAQHDYRS